MHQTVFTELSLVIVLVTAVSLVMRLLRQPLILGYIITGILVGPSVLHLIHSKEAFDGFSTIGIALLLFIIGLGMNIAVIRRVGKSVFLTSAALLIIMGSLGALVSLSLLGLHLKESYIIGLALSFSSTIIVVKTLTDKKEQNRLHGQLAIGVLIIEDIVATLALLFVTSSKNHAIGFPEFQKLFIYGLLIVALLLIASKFILPKLVRAVAVSQESLFLFAIAWGFGIASLTYFAGFSVEIGALFAGISLASLPYAQEIESRLKPLRDFFIVLFFITLGESLTIGSLRSAILPALALSFVVIALKPTAVTILLGLLGYPKRVSFKAGIHLSQISEFSIVLVILAVANGLAGQHIVAIITLVALITITFSTYLTSFDSKLFGWFDKLKLFYGLFDAGRTKKESRVKTDYQLLLFGYHHGGHEFVRTFKKLQKRFIVIDYNPSVIDVLQHQQIPCLYGDATDAELLEEVGVEHARLIVSTIADFETNQELIKHLNFFNPDTVMVCSANDYEEAIQLYELGCSYVMIPHHDSSEYLSTLIRKNGIERQHFDRYRAKHLRHLELTHPLDVAEEGL